MNTEKFNPRELCSRKLWQLVSTETENRSARENFRKPLPNWPRAVITWTNCSRSALAGPSQRAPEPMGPPLSTMAKPPARRSSSQDIDRFLQHSRNIAAFVAKQPRLLFAIDATASRQPTWDSACQVQQEMFQRHRVRSPHWRCNWSTTAVFGSSPPAPGSPTAQQLARLMAGVRCEGGHTQIARLLRHALAEHRKTPVRALVFIGDAVEESRGYACATWRASAAC